MINLVGLTVGIAVCILIMLFVKDELSYDRFHSKSDRIVLFQQFEGASGSGNAFADILHSEIGQIENTTRLVKSVSLIGNEDQSYYELNFYFADSTTFEIFDFPLVSGNEKTALSAPFSLVISESMASKYFPGQDPIGQSLEYGNKRDLTIAGVMKDLPDNSHIDIDFLCSFESKADLLGYDWSGYWNSEALTYLLLSSGTTSEDINVQMQKVVDQANDPNSGIWQLRAIPLRDIYLKYTLDDKITASRAIENIWIFSIVAVFILSLACFNYVNLVTARASTRAKEVGVRKVLGAKKNQLLAQFIGESGLVLGMGALLALTAVHFILPAFNQFSQKNLMLTDLLSPVNAVFFVGSFAMLCLITGIYPSLILASFQPVSILKKIWGGSRNDAWFRKLLVFLQFAVSVALILATIVVVKQLNYIHSKDLGYDREQVMNITFQGDATEPQKKRVKLEIEKLGTVVSSTLSNLMPGQGTFENKMVEEHVPEGKDVSYKYLTIDENFLETFDIPLIEGRFFTETSNPELNQFVVNQSMVAYKERRSSRKENGILQLSARSGRRLCRSTGRGGGHRSHCGLSSERS